MRAMPPRRVHRARMRSKHDGGRVLAVRGRVRVSGRREHEPDDKGAMRGGRGVVRARGDRVPAVQRRMRARADAGEGVRRRDIGSGVR